MCATNPQIRAVSARLLLTGSALEMAKGPPPRPVEETTDIDVAETVIPLPLAEDAAEATAPANPLEDNRPTEIYDPKQRRDIHATREQRIGGSTVLEMMRNSEHHLSAPLRQLVERAQADLRAAQVDARTTLVLQHEFEFDLRVGYRLILNMFDADGRCIEVRAEVDSDGREVRRGSIVSHVVPI